jgi:hypothetical protein
MKRRANAGCKRVPKDAVGKWALVRWDCVGVHEVVIVDLDDDGMSALVFEPRGECAVRVEADQIFEILEYLLPPPRRPR